MPASVLDDPFVSFGRAVCGDLASALRREWLVTNGIGGYASGTIAGPATRRYHGLLVAATAPPGGRRVLVGALDEWAIVDGARLPLGCHEFVDAIAPPGYLNLESFALEGLIPVWRWAFAGALLERRIWMAEGENTTFVAYRLVRSTAAVRLEIRPLLNDRDFHTLARPADPGLEPSAASVAVGFPTTTVHAGVDRGAFEPQPEWWHHFRHREEQARGLDCESELFAPGVFRLDLSPGETATVRLTAADGATTAEASAAHERSRQERLLQDAGAADEPRWIQQLTLAASQFVATGTTANGAGRRTIVAGYHWFADWGRDTMIALPGLCLATGRHAEAAAILRSFAPFLRDGLLPNNLPDRAGMEPGYNTVDAALWYILAVHSYTQAIGDGALAADLLPTLTAIVQAYTHGTRFGIGVDADGLLHAGEPGVQLTWMDAKVGDRVVTPRMGKPVEINALWHSALRAFAELCREPSAGGEAASALADHTRESFRNRFLRPDRASLADVVDGPHDDDWSVRPNQIFALSLPFPLLAGAEARALVDAVARALLTSYGLRTLAPADPAYRGRYAGDVSARDGAYHQGTAWAWLLGPFAEAHYRAYGDASAALAYLEPLNDHLLDAGLGTISEIFDGDPPHLPRGCIAQAWSVAETLRVYALLRKALQSRPPPAEVWPHPAPGDHAGAPPRGDERQRRPGRPPTHGG